MTLDQETWTPRLASDAQTSDELRACRYGERGCTLCARVCARFGSWETEADQEMWSRTRTAEEVFGVHRRLLLVGASDHEIAAAGQDGGLGTALLLYAIENDCIDAALVSYFDEDMRPRAGLARTRADLLNCAGSRYTYSPNLLAIAEAADPTAQRLGLISVGCQTSVPAVARARGARKLAKRFTLVVGLLCSRTFSDMIYADLLDAEYGVPRRQITKVNIKGRLQVWHQEGGNGSSYLEVPLSKCREFTRPGCIHCPDFGAEHADLSLGGIGKFAGRTLVIVRTELGEQILNDMEQSELITVADALENDPDAVALIRRLATQQRQRWPATPGDKRSPALVPESP